ncbi:MAG TPA: alpha/beta fold hydrolase [Thermoanaerobaculia bacterium]|jgi:pimeloyl-ACP methyl ester carboxylesterase
MDLEIAWKGQTARIRQMGSGPAVILLHGYPLDGAMWSGVARALSPRFRVLKPDLPGRGDTPASSAGSIDDYADFLEAILRGVEAPAGLAGFSMGGYAALALVSRRPESLRALALIDTRASADDDTGKAKRNEAITTVRSSGVASIAEAMVPRLLAPASLNNGDLVDRVRRIILRQRPETIEADLSAMRDRPDRTAVLPGIAIPTLVVVGAEDTITPPSDSQAMARAIPGARLVTVPAAAHLTPMERPGIVAAALGDFFGEALGTSS